MTAVFILIASLVAMIALLHSPVFEADARIHIPEIITEGSASSENSSEQKNISLQTAVEILQGNVLAEQVMKDIGGMTRLFPDLARHGKKKEKLLSQALAAFQERLNVAVIKETRIIQITFQHPKAEMSAQVVKTMLRFLQKELKKLQTPHEALGNEQLHLLNQEMHRTARALAMFEQSNQLLEKKRTRTAEQYEKIKALFSTEQERLQEQLKKLNTLEEQFADRLTPAESASKQEEREQFAEERKDILRLKIYEQNLKEKYGQGSSGDRLIKNVRLQIASLENRLYTEAGIPETEHEKLEAAAEQIVLAKLSYSKEQKKTDRLQRQLRQLENTVQRLAEQDAVRDELRREAETARERYATLLEQLRTEEQFRARSEQILIIEKPVLPLAPIQAKKMPALVWAIAFGLIGSILYGILGVFRKDIASAP